MPSTIEIETTKYAQVQWEAQDLIDRANELGLEISYEDADRLLAERSSLISEAMVEAGWYAIDAIIEDYQD